MRRVTWPSRREVYATTVVVILTSIFFGVYLWGLDLALSWVVGRIFGLFGAA
jgi:preprotein translocase subunit SecE